MKAVIVGATIVVVLLAVGTAHHDNAEEHLLDTLVDSFVEKNVQKTGSALNNYVDDLLLKVAEKVRSILKGKEPYPIPEIPTKHIEDKNVQVTVTLTNVKENKGSTFVINKLKNNMFLMTEQYDITFPTLTLFGNYNISGKVLNKQVTGKGDFNVDITNLHAWGKAYAHLVHAKYVQLKKLNLDYKMDDIKATATGLKVEGLTDKQVQKLLSDSLLQYFTDNEPVVSATVADQLLQETNQLLQGMTISDLIKWFKNFIKPH